MKADNMEREHIYFRGHTDGFAYLQKIGALKTNNPFGGVENPTPLLHIFRESPFT